MVKVLVKFDCIISNLTELFYHVNMAQVIYCIHQSVLFISITSKGPLSMEIK